MRQRPLDPDASWSGIMTALPQTTANVEKRAELLEDFEYFDENQDGRMQFDEFVHFLKGIDAQMSAHDCRVGFTAIDANRDGLIEFEEFMEWWCSK